MKITKTISLLVILLLSLKPAHAETGSITESLHSSGKMGAVIAVMSIIFAGIVIYLVMIDRKLSRMEKEMKNKK